MKKKEDILSDDSETFFKNKKKFKKRQEKYEKYRQKENSNNKKKRHNKFSVKKVDGKFVIASETSEMSMPSSASSSTPETKTFKKTILKK